ncbi:unnamed protein product [Rhodiola kirilowii]
MRPEMVQARDSHLGNLHLLLLLSDKLGESNQSAKENFDDDVLREQNQPWCIYEGPKLEDIMISTGVVHNLPKFSGTQGESVTTHLQHFHGICQNLKPYGVEVEDFKLKVFYFSLIDAANDWFLSLPSGSIQTWAQMQGKFLAKYYPAGRAT